METNHPEQSKSLADDLFKEKLGEYMGDESLGSPKLLALSDALQKLEAQSTRDFYLDFLAHPPQDIAWDRLGCESIIRTSEVRIAIVDTQIESRRVTIQGYQEAIRHIEDEIDRTLVSIRTPSNQKELSYVLSELIEDILNP